MWVCIPLVKIDGLKKIIPIKVLTREICSFEIYMFFKVLVITAWIAELITSDKVPKIYLCPCLWM